MEMCTFPEAVQKIVQLADLDVSIANMNDYGRASGLYDQQKRIEQVLKVATLYYSVKMVTDPAASLARKHLMSRRIRPETAFKFQIGYAPQPSFSSPSNSIYRAGEEKEKESDQSSSRSITANITGTYCCI
jgi:DNA primase